MSPSVLEEKWPEIAEAQPELLAQHCAQAGLVEQAIAYYTRAGQRALARSAMAEATAQLKKGLELLTSLPDSASRQRQELELQIGTRAGADRDSRLRCSGGGGDLRACSRPVRAARPTTANRAGAIRSMGASPSQRTAAGGARARRRLAAAGRGHGRRGGDECGPRLSGATCFQLGEFLTARAHLEKALARFDPKDRPFYMSLAPRMPGSPCSLISRSTCFVLATSIKHASEARRQSRRRASSVMRSV